MSESSGPAAPESILQEAQKLIHGARNESYGHPRDNFAAIAALWNAYIDSANADALEAQDVANMMILLKVARVNNGKFLRDSYVDIAGYAGTAERLQEPQDDPVEQPEDTDNTWASPFDAPEGVWMVADCTGDTWWSFDRRGAWGRLGVYPPERLLREATLAYGPFHLP